MLTISEQFNWLVKKSSRQQHVVNTHRVINTLY